MLIDQSRRNDETVQFFITKLREIHELVSKWRTEFPNSEVAEKCATDLEVLVIRANDSNGHVRFNANQL